ncbi:MAG: guanylate kinase [Sandaracinaceae bacterium]
MLLLIICSPSGAGKSTLTRHLMSSFDGLAFSVSHTSRPPRGKEQDGVQYHFIDRPRFEAMIAAGEFLEWADVHGNLYGTSLAEIARAESDGKRGILFDVDYQGARQIRAKRDDAVGVFVLPPSMDELYRRLERRAEDTPEVIAKRFAKAREEIGHYASFDYLLVNDDLVEAQKNLEGIVRAELTRRPHHAGFAEQLLGSFRD